MTLYTSYFGNIRNIPHNFVLIAISSSVPDGISCVWFPEFAPSVSVRNQFKNSGDLRTFRRKYEHSISSMNIVEKLQPFLDGDRTLVFLCYEKNAQMCHRSIFAEYLSKKLGMPVEEYRNKM